MRLPRTEALFSETLRVTLPVLSRNPIVSWVSLRPFVVIATGVDG